MNSDFRVSPINNNKELAYRPDIDGLRALAVLVVIGYHAASTKFHGGFIGVDIFFVISGFLISSIIYREIRHGKFSIFEFYIRRIRRIYPPLLAVLVAVSIAGWVILLPSNYALLGKQIAGGSAFVANFVLWGQAGYLDGDGGLKPLLHLWSLGVEEQYYLIFPVLCIVLYRTASKIYLYFAIVFIIMSSLTASILVTDFDRTAAFYLPLTRVWELFFGSALSLYQHYDEDQRAPRNNRLLNSAISVVGIALIIYALLRTFPTDPFPGWLAALPCAGAVLLIMSGPRSLVNRIVFSSRPAVFVGLISYPLYLWHWPLLSFAMILQGGDLSRPVKLAVVVSSFFLAFLTHIFLEKPIRRLGSGDRRKGVALWLFSGVSLAGLFGISLVFTHGFPGRYSAQVRALDHGFDLAAAYREGACFLRPNQSGSDFADGCSGVAGGPPSAPLLLIWGDSHAADLYPGFRAAQGEAPFRLAQYTASACPPILGFEPAGRPFCRAINDEMPARIAAMKPDIVVLSANWDGILTGRRGGSSEATEKGFKNTLTALRSIGVPKIVVLGPAPIWSNSVPNLLADEMLRYPGRRLPDVLPRKLLADSNGGDDAALRSISKEGGATYISLISRLCDDSGCVATTGPTWADMIAYDTSHLTEHGSMVVTQRIWGEIAPLLAEHGS